MELCHLLAYDSTMNNVDQVQRIYSAFGCGDIPSVLATLDETISWREAEGTTYQPSGDAWVGPHTVLENLFVRLGDDCQTPFD